MVNIMQSSNHPSQRQPEPQYKGNPYPVGMPHSLIAATMYEGSVRNFHSNPVSSDIMNHLLEDKRVDDYRSWTGNRVSKYTACSNIIANEISHLYNRDDLNFDDWQYLLLYNKFKKILTERGTCSPETITFLIYNLINMVKNDLTLRNLLMISSDEYVEEVLTKFVEMALNQRTYGYEYTKPNLEAQKMKSSRKHLQRSSVAASMANTVSKAWGWKDSEHPFPIQAPSQLKPENFYVYGRHLGGSDESINIKDGCIPVPRVVYRNSPSTSYKEPAVAEAAGATREPEKKKNSKRYGPRGPYKRTLIRMRMREISRMRRHIRNKANESFFLNTEFDNSVKDLKGESQENSNKGEEAAKPVETTTNGKGDLSKKDQEKALAQEESTKPSKMRTRQSAKASESIEQTGTGRAEAIADLENAPQIPGTTGVQEGLKMRSGPEVVHPAIVPMTISERRREGTMVPLMEHTKREKRHDQNKGGEWLPPSASKMYAYYTGVQEGYIDPHMIYSSNASTNNSMSSSPLANDYFNDAQSTRLNSETTSEDYNYPEITYAINRQMNIHEVRSKEFAYYDPSKRDMALYAEGMEYRPLYRTHTPEQMVEKNKSEKEIQPLRKFTTEGPYHSKPIPDSIGERSTRAGRNTKAIKELKETIAHKDANVLDLNVKKDKIVGKRLDKLKKKAPANEIHSEKVNDPLETVVDDKEQNHENLNGIGVSNKTNRINAIDTIDAHQDTKTKEIYICIKGKGHNPFVKDLEFDNERSKDIKCNDDNFEKIDTDFNRKGDDKHVDSGNKEGAKVPIIDIDFTPNHVKLTSGICKEIEHREVNVHPEEFEGDEVMEEAKDKEQPRDREQAQDKEQAEEMDDPDVKEGDASGEEGKRKEENTIWDMVQKHHKSTHASAPVAVKNTNSINSEAADEKDDMSLLIREHYHISENVPSSQTLPFPNAYKNPKSIKWSYTETKRFYNAIETFGTDLLMVRAFMPEFTDRQVYDKFKLEERKNPQLMQNALQTHKSISLKQYEQKHGKIDAKTHYNPNTDPLLQGEAATTKSGLQLNPDAAEHFDTEAHPKVDDKIINLFM
ncbi:homeodomain-like containing protein [Theileria orientalis strain Shintoku]|uniref:Homeodomain-like containing protein n=1 Tax=Theileria orientalis strain Shintoku TaxID=869250 RepID=J4D918_THEOR|nr:homeodomain-like containing protein [Theileria orientalis strain Shintoku]BAM41140.1 homeodomain-like containing protein [Theileria orientalis strain Shintoku]|eukprot:XP_009691441.1 homeodomain-like containing protein [Theileria orientalis strain Shintoku]